MYATKLVIDANRAIFDAAPVLGITQIRVSLEIGESTPDRISNMFRRSFKELTASHWPF